MSLTLAKTLCKLGSKLACAEDCIETEDAMSTLDKTRRAAMMSREDELSSKPPLFFTDSFLPHECFLYQTNDSRDGNVFVRGNQAIKAPSLHVVGGVMFESKRCKFPVSVLYSNRSNALVLHAGAVPISVLELEFYDNAFQKNCAWINYVGDKFSVDEFKQWHKEASIGSRTAGLCNTPEYLLGNDSYTVIRHGLTAFLSIRSPENAAECKQVIDRLASDIRMYPIGDKDLMNTAYTKQHIYMAFHARTDKEISVPYSPHTRSPEECLRMAHKVFAYAPMTFISTIILNNAVDDARDEQDNPIAELDTGIPYRHKDASVFDECGATESAFVLSAKSTNNTDLEEFHDNSYTIATVMEPTGRTYATKMLFNNSDTEGAVHAVVEELFEPTYINDVLEMLRSASVRQLTLNTAISTLRSFLDNKQAICIVSRDHDGRISNAKLFGKETTVNNVNKDALSRLVVYTWVQFIVLDKDRVSVLMTRDPEYTDGTFPREKLRMATTSTGGSDVVQKMRPKLNDLIDQVLVLKSANEETVRSISDFKRKLDFLVEQKATATDPKDEQELPRKMQRIVDELKKSHDKLVVYQDNYNR